MKYILNKDKQIVATDNLFEWAEFYNSPDKIIARTTIELIIGDIVISTVFLGIGYIGPSNLFETMVFGLEEDFREEFQYRWNTYEEALKGHNEIVNQIKREREDIIGNNYNEIIYI